MHGIMSSQQWNAYQLCAPALKRDEYIFMLIYALYLNVMFV